MPLVNAQAAARKVTPKFLRVAHPVGGLDAGELVSRIDAAYSDLRAAAGF
ncbi:MAG: hypothetical protein AAF458_03725 [Pseudomonadota bacterium]